MSVYPRIALCIGHSRPVDGHPEGGAVSVGGIQEWQYNSNLADHIAAHLTRHRIRWFIVDRYQGAGYTSAQKWLATHLAEREADAALELHFNSAGKTARGHEWLYWHSSKSGRALAGHLDHEMRLQLPPHLIPARGAKPLDSTSRGAEFVRRTHCPSVICEPFFGSNPDDWRIATENIDKIAIAIANGVYEWVG